MGNPVSFEIPADDLARATSFYKEVFGWSSLLLPFDFALVNADGKPVDPRNASGGITIRTKEAQTPVLIITVPSIAEAIERVKTAGGQVLTEKSQVAEFGFSSYVKDTEGNVVCLWEEIKPTTAA